MARRPVTRPQLASQDQVNAAMGMAGAGPTTLTNIDGMPGQTVFGNNLDMLDAKSDDFKAMEKYWKTVSDIVDGSDAMRAAHDTYLPKFPNETGTDYDFRWKNAKFTNVYRDILENLASKPFEQEVTLIAEGKTEIPEQFEQFVEDVDGAGNNISVFLADTFFNGINSAIDWIFVDYSTSDPTARPRTVQDEAQMGIRPFWTHVLGSNVLDVRSRVMNGKETIYYLRMQEWEPEGKQIRIMRSDGVNTAWELYAEKAASSTDPHKFRFISSGRITINTIPMVPFITGRRKGRSFRFDPVMKDAADLQVELFQQESGLKNIETLAGFPMLVGTGVNPPKIGTGANAKPATLATGPNVVLYGGSDGQNAGTWQFISPPAEILKFLLDHIKETINQLRELGRNPLTAQSGNLTVVTTAVAAKKGNSAAQMWGMGLKDAAENALVLTGMWLNIPKTVYDPEVNVFTDFDIDGQQTDVASLLEARKNREISLRTFWHEMQRRGFLSGEFDPEVEEQALLDEIVAAEGDDLTDNPAPPNDPNAVG